RIVGSRAPQSGASSVLEGGLRSGHDPRDVRVFPRHGRRRVRAILPPLLPLLLLVPLPVLSILLFLAFGGGGRHWTARFSGSASVDSDRLHVLRPRPLGPHALGERDALTLAQVFEPGPLDGGHVKKDVLARARLDEAEALVSQSLDRAFGHGLVLRFWGS